MEMYLTGNTFTQLFFFIRQDKQTEIIPASDFFSSQSHVLAASPVASAPSHAVTPRSYGNCRPAPHPGINCKVNCSAAPTGAF